MLLSVQPAEITVASTRFVFVVPGHQRWSLRSVFAEASRDVGGAPNRTYTLTITDGTTTVAQVGAADAGNEPGTCQITWANTPAASVFSGTQGITVAPLPPVTLNPGYDIIGEITNGAPADAWITAVAWFDFAYAT